MNARVQNIDNGRARIAFEDAQRCQLSIRTPGLFQTLAFRASTEIPELNPTFVEVQVKAISINAKDYYVLRGLVNTRGATCSLDFSGIVIRVGTVVTDFVCGDRVVGMAPNHLGSHIQVPQWACCKLRKDKKFAVMAAVPVVSVTALYALQYRARLRAGESVLIHSAAGGAGMAAIQVAKNVGARIYATVGTEAKQDLLVRDFGLVRENIFSSRNADFVQGILGATAGAGVDVVFSSLTGDLLHASWDVCADFGLFMDISKRDSLDGGRLDMRPFSRSATYHAFDLTDLYYSRNRKLNILWQE
jgi:NADPH:quinone reductase-like Zn-dependent oxidoreductase